MTTFDNAPATVSVNSYSDISQLRGRLLKMAEQVRDRAGFLSDDAKYAELDRLAERLSSDVFRVMFVGEFNRGKSTAINAMLGRKILPTWAVPTTAIINEVRWGEQPRAAVFHRDAPTVPIEVDVNQLGSYVTVDEDDEDAVNPYERAVVEWPLELCRNGVLCIDSPGLNAHDLHDEITNTYLQTTDVLVFVFDCTSALSRSEQTFLKTRVISSGGQDLFFVGNKINLIDELDDRLRVERKVTSILTGLLGEPPKLFFLNAKQALSGRIDGDDFAVEQSNLPALEHALEHYLTGEPGRRRLARSSRLLQIGADELRRVAEQRVELLAQDRELLRRRYDAQAEPLQTLEQQRDLILVQVRNRMNDIEREAARQATQLLRRVADDIPQWAGEIDPHDLTQVTGNPLKMKGRINERVQAVVAILDERVKLEFAGWQSSELLPMVEQRLTDIANDIDDSIDDFLSRIDDIRYELTFTPNREVDAEGAEVSGRERVLAAAAGLLFTGAGGAVEGSMFGFKGVIRSLLPSLAAGIGLVLLHFTPLAIFAALLGMGAGRSLWKLKSVNEKIVADVATNLAVEVRKSAGDRGNELGAALRDKLRDVEDALQAGLENQILVLRRELDIVLNARDTSDEENAARNEALRGAAAELDRLSRRAGDVFHDLAR